MKTIFKKLSDLLTKSGLSQSELAIITKVFIGSILLSIVTVVGVWGYFKISTNHSQPKLPKKTHATVTVTRSGASIDLQANLLIAESYIQRGKPATAIPHLERALELQPDDIKIRYLLAQALLEAGFYEQSLSQISDLEFEEAPDSLKESICVTTAMSLFYSGQISESTERLKSCLADHPGSAEALCFMGIVKSFNAIDSSTARHYFEEAIQKDSSYVEAWYQLGRIEMMQGDSFQARKHLLYALELDPLHVKSHARLGMLYYYMGNTSLAENCYRTALALNPGDYNTRYNLAELLYTNGDTINALKVFTHVLQDNPEHSNANFRVGLISMRNNMYKEAIGYFERAIQKEPDNIRILLQLAVSYEKVQLFSDALAIYQRILSIDDLHPVAQQKVKMLSQQLNNNSK